MPDKSELDEQPEFQGKDLSTDVFPQKDLEFQTTKKGSSKYGYTRYPDRVRQRVRAAYLSGQYSTLKDLASSFDIADQIVAGWREAEHWDDIRSEIDKEATKRIVNRLAEQKAMIDDQHFKLWGAFDAQVYMWMKRASDQKKLLNPKILDLLSKVLERAQKGRRIACGADDPSEMREQRHLVIEYVGLDSTIEHAERQIENAKRMEQMRSKNTELKDATVYPHREHRYMQEDPYDDPNPDRHLEDPPQRPGTPVEKDEKNPQ